MKYLDVSLEDVVYGKSRSTIKSYTWFEQFPYPESNLFFMVLKTPALLENVQGVLMDTLAKIFDITVEILSEDFEPVFFYGVTCKLHTPNYWQTYKERLFLYSMSLVHLFDTSNISDRFFPNTFIDLIFGISEGMREPINPDRFFHAGMAKFMSSISANETREWGLGMWQSIKIDLRAIKYILNSPRNTKEVLSRVTSNDFTEISEEIFTEFETMRRTF